MILTTRTFCFVDDVKVFDFGLCKNLSPKLKTKDGMFKLTGRTGSFPYMAPGKLCCCAGSFPVSDRELIFCLSSSFLDRGGAMQAIQHQC